MGASSIWLAPQRTPAECPAPLSFHFENPRGTIRTNQPKAPFRAPGRLRWTRHHGHVVQDRIDRFDERDMMIPGPMRYFAGLHPGFGLIAHMLEFVLHPARQTPKTVMCSIFQCGSKILDGAAPRAAILFLITTLPPKQLLQS